MKELLELIRIATPTKLKNIHSLGQSETIADRLYWLLHSGKIKNDDDALMHLYSGKKSKVATTPRKAVLEALPIKDRRPKVEKTKRKR